MKNIMFIIKIKVQDIYFQETLENLKSLYKLTHQLDSGILQYDFYEVQDEANTFCVIENWKSDEEYQVHRNKEHTLKFKSFLDGKILDYQRINLVSNPIQNCR